MIAGYGLVFFLLLFFYDYIPRRYVYQKAYQYIYTLFEYLFFAFILYLNIQTKLLKRIVGLCILGFIAFQVTFYITQMDAKLDAVPVGIETILIFIFIFFFFYEQFLNVKDQFIYAHYCFWICIGMLIYLGGNLFFNLLANHLDTDNFWYTTYIIETVKNLLFAVGLLIYIKSPETTLSNKNSKIPYLDIDLT